MRMPPPKSIVPVSEATKLLKSNQEKHKITFDKLSFETRPTPWKLGFLKFRKRWVPKHDRDPSCEFLRIWLQYLKKMKLIFWYFQFNQRNSSLQSKELILCLSIQLTESLPPHNSLINRYYEP